MNTFEQAEPRLRRRVKPHAAPGSARDRADSALRLLVFLPLVLLTLLFGGARPWIWQTVCGLTFLGITGFIDRALVACYDAGIHPVLLITKTDLRDPAALVAHYEALDLEVMTSGAATFEAEARPCAEAS